MIVILVDADACPVKEEVARVALRHGLDAYFVSNQHMRLPLGTGLQRVIVPEGPDKADDWIAARAGRGAIVVTADIPLAARCVRGGAKVTTPAGKPFTDANIGMTLATRNLMQDLREAQLVSTYNAAFTSKDRSRFLQVLEQMVQAWKKDGA